MGACDFKDELSFLKRKFGCSLTGLCSCIVDSCCKNLFGSHDAGPMLLLCWWMPTEATRTDDCNMYTAKKNATQNFSRCRKYMAFRLCKCKKTNINNYRKNRHFSRCRKYMAFRLCKCKITNIIIIIEKTETQTNINIWRNKLTLI